MSQNNSTKLCIEMDMGVQKLSSINRLEVNLQLVWFFQFLKWMKNISTLMHISVLDTSTLSFTYNCFRNTCNFLFIFSP